MMNEIIKESIAKGISYVAYVELINRFVAEEKTTGAEQTKQRIDFTKLNASRMRRLDKTLIVPEQSKQVFLDLKEKQTWFVLIESWCADGAQTIPILNKIAEASPAIDLKVLLRDDNPEVMDLFLTNGTRSIPKLIIVDNDGNVLNTWGPRSQAATNLVLAYKKENGKIDDSFKKFLQVWYNKNKGEAIVEDLVKVVEDSLTLEKDFD
ncbi:thioredoxin-like protein [Aquimarina sp. MAR_2010_214]|uniref:thioredoxin family protein n=1 Tax=Aquimarina sp. MAR_2010_214 TaxID=1250026 RepID=UPI000CC0A39A|nr:thioredoxin family protein [Aquimarina sp. MAR_2010_214]PKV49263.1 thioredoxin-like protein [Aquimarina sp. MAR_2010_214]